MENTLLTKSYTAFFMPPRRKEKLYGLNAKFPLVTNDQMPRILSIMNTENTPYKTFTVGSLPYNIPPSYFVFSEF